MTLMRTCTKCFLQKPVEEFGWKIDSLGKDVPSAKSAQPNGLLIGITRTRTGKKKTCAATIKPIER